MAASKRTLVIIAFAALYVIWGSTYLGIKFSIETIPPFLMAGARFVLAGMIMYAIAWSQGIGKSTWANWRTSFIIGACLLLGGNGGVTISEQYIDSGLAALIVAIVPIYMVLLGWATGMARRRTKSCHRNIDPACHKFHLVGGLALLARCETRSLTISYCCSTNDLWRHIAFARWRRNRRTAAISSRVRFHVVARLICLSRHHRCCGRL